MEVARRGLPAELVLGRATAADPPTRPVWVMDLVRDLRRAMGADVVGLGGVDPTTPVRNPDKGLRAFEEFDAGDFHGREELVEELVAAVTARPLVAVVGPSGSGKSSLVRAGLVPALRRGDAGHADWLFTDLFPGAHPFEELETALLQVATDRPDGLLADEFRMLRASKQVLPAGHSAVPKRYTSRVGSCTMRLWSAVLTA